MKLRSSLCLALAAFGCATTAPTPPPAAPAETPAAPTPTATPAAPEPPKQPPALWADAATYSADCAQALARAKARQGEIKAPGPRSLATLNAYNAMLAELDRASSLANLMENVHPDQGVREAAEKCERDVSGLVSELNLDRSLYDAVVAVDKASLDADAARFQFKVVREFKRAGVDKDDATREKLKNLKAEMVKVGQDFSRNIRDDSRKIEVDPKDLAGLPEDYLKAHPAKADGKVTLSIDYPDYFPVMNYSGNEGLRKRLTVEFLNRGYPKNEGPMKKLLELRAEYAKILGAPSWAQYMAEDKMVGSAKGIEKFIAEITKSARPKMESDLKELLARKKKDDKNAKAIESWDRIYYVERVRSEKYGFDAQAARPYFPVGQTLQGMFDLYAQLFGVEFRPVADAPVWHPSVHVYDLYEGSNRLGRFYLDLHPRASKYSHAAMFPMVTGTAGGPIAEAALVTNFPDPAAGQALLDHAEVTTMFHEFGHLIHHLLASGSAWSNLAGINTEWDFVEAPSQLLEEWTWDAGVLQRFAKHAETHQPIPAEMVEKMRASEDFGKGTAVMRQVFLTALSYELHARDPKKVDLDKVTRELIKKYSPVPDVDGTHFYAGFGHLEGYSSMYYTYQWSLALAKDIFTRFEKAGLLDAGTARDYREKILKQGGRHDAKDLVHDFLGRDTNLEAYKKWLEK
ncbi:MAG: M3 family metallopeptidase [Myxococcota bacterium]